MKKFSTCLVLFTFLLAGFSAHAVNKNKILPDSLQGRLLEWKTEEHTSLTAKQQKKLEKVKSKMEKKLAKKAKRSGVWDDSRFRLGAILFLAALALVIVAAIGILAGFFSFIAGLLALAGLVLIVWALVENYA